MLTLILVLLFNILLNFQNNTWALSKRALFSLGGKTFFDHEVNQIALSYNYLKCEKYNLSLLDSYLGNELLELKEVNFIVSNDKKAFYHSKLSIKDMNSARAASFLLGLIRYVKSGSSPKLNQKKSCAYNKDYDQFIPYIVAVRDYLKNSIVSDAQSKSDQKSSIMKFKQSVLNIDPVRYYFGTE